MSQGLGLGLRKEAQGGAADAAGAARGRYVLWVFSPENSLDQDMAEDRRPRAAKSFGQDWWGKEAWDCSCQGLLGEGVGQCSFSSAESSFPWAVAEGLVPGPQCKMVKGLVCPVFQKKPTRADKTLHIKTCALCKPKLAQKIQFVHTGLCKKRCSQWIFEKQGWTVTV